MDLQPLCGDEWRPALCRPFAIELDGSEWTVATNGHAALLLRDHDEQFGPGLMPAEDFRSATVDRVGPCLGAVSYAELARVLQCETEVECEQCGGAGELTCEACGTPCVRCAVCDGHGKRPPDASWGEILGCKLNRVLLWRFLSVVSAETVHVHPATSPVLPMMFAAQDDSWRIVVMPGRAEVIETIEWTFPAELVTGSATPLTTGGVA